MTKVMVNGLPGKMASKTAGYVIRQNDLELVPLSLTGLSIKAPYLEIGGISIELVFPQDREARLQEIVNQSPFIAVDFSIPSAANENADFYCRNGMNFVMGTTGGDRQGLEEVVAKSNVSAVIAPNMAKQIVAFQAMMKYTAQNFPRVFEGYSLRINESHQNGKADTSGTAKAMVDYFNMLGISFKKEQIVMERNPDKQRVMGVPEEHLSGHGWHTYTLTSKDGTVLLEFKHNVNGRDVYALGTIDAIRYLNVRISEGNKGKVYSMIDVLKGGH